MKEIQINLNLKVSVPTQALAVLNKKSFGLEIPQKRMSVLGSFRANTGIATPMKQAPPLQRRETMRVHSSTNKPRKSQIYTVKPFV